MSRTRVISLLSVLVFSCLVEAPVAKAWRIEAKRGKTYRLTKQHGPWMIMVASLADIPQTLKEVRNGRSVAVVNTRYRDGLSAQEAADLLVFDLRKKGIPAYTYHRDALEESIKTVDRLGRLQQRSYTAQHDQICVIAGNYSSINDRIAQKTLKFIKSHSPKSWEESGIYKPTPGRPRPLSGAIMTINPKLSPEEVSQRKRNPLLLRLNTGQPYTLLSNKGEYTLAVASFHGTSRTGIGNGLFGKKLSQQPASGSRMDLYDAGASAVLLAQHLRAGKFLVVADRMKGQDSATMYRSGSPVEAYVYHEQHRSIVAVGSFDSPNDPRLKKLHEQFRAKMVWGESASLVPTPEYIILQIGKKKKTEQKTFIFDPQPQIMKVPRLR